MWRGRTLGSKANEYEKYLEMTGYKDYDTTTGNRGVLAFRKDDKESDTTEFVLVSFWDSASAIREFAGDNIEKAVYYPRDKDFLLEMEPNVTHYELIHSSDKVAISKPSKKTSTKKRKARRQ
jgi:heme-degrading monooxygenase HmoA